MTEFALTFEQWSQKDEIPFKQLGAVLAAYSAVDDAPSDQWQRVRELTLKSLSAHALTPGDDPEFVLASLINARAFCGANRGETDDRHYLQISSCVDDLRGHVEQWSNSAQKDWMLAALDADSAVTDLRRSQRGFIEADHQSISDRCLRYFSTIIEIDETSQLSESYQMASRKMTPRVLDWLLCSLPHVDDYADKLDVVLSTSENYLRACEDSNKRDVRFTSLSAITEGLLDAAANETGDLQSKLINLSKRAILIVEGIVNDRAITPEDSSRALELKEFKVKLENIMALNSGQQ